MWTLQQLFLGLLVCLFIFKYLKVKWVARSLPPGPSPLPLIGNLWTLSFVFNPDTLTMLAKHYGNTYTIWLGHTPMVVLNGYQAVKNALVSHSEELSGRPVSSFVQDITNGKGIATSNGHTWKQQRRFGLMTLRNLGLGKRSLESRIQEEARCLVDSIIATNGKPVDVSYIITHAVANVISAVVFGHRFSFDDIAFQKLVANNNLLAESIGTKWAKLYDAFPWLMRHVPGPHHKTFEFMRLLKDFVRNEVRIHEQNGAPEEPNDVIDHYLAQIRKTNGEPGSTFDEANMIQVVSDLFVAGSETTVNTLQWALLLILAHPDIQRKMQKELDAVLDGTVIYYEDRKKLPYINAVIHEVQRYGSIASVGIPRSNINNVTINGFPLKKDTIILPNIDSVLRDPQYWETPYKFNPNHFLDKDGKFVASEAFLPFSAGHRVCLGEQLARYELFIFLTTLVKALNFNVPEDMPEVNIEHKSRLTSKPHQYKICALPR